MGRAPNRQRHAPRGAKVGDLSIRLAHSVHRYILWTIDQFGCTAMKDWSEDEASLGPSESSDVPPELPSDNRRRSG